jgi:hypothetical protein
LSTKPAAKIDGRKKLTEADVIAIRNSRLNVQQLARRFKDARISARLPPY